MDCLFCKIAAGEIPADIVYQDETLVAFRDINPVAPHHILLIPRKHIATVNDAGEKDAALIGTLALKAAELARELGFDESGYRLIMNCNRAAGQTVFHIHMHLLGGRDFSWPPG